MKTKTRRYGLLLSVSLWLIIGFSLYFFMIHPGVVGTGSCMKSADAQEICSDGFVRTLGWPKIYKDSSWHVNNLMLDALMAMVFIVPIASILRRRNAHNRD